MKDRVRLVVGFDALNALLSEFPEARWTWRVEWENGARQFLFVVDVAPVWNGKRPY